MRTQKFNFDLKLTKKGDSIINVLET